MSVPVLRPRLVFERIAERPPVAVRDWHDVARLAASIIGEQEHETELAILVRDGGVVAVLRVAEGTPFAVTSDTERVAACALEYGATTVYSAHNHPDGSSEPSAEDYAANRAAAAYLTARGIGFAGGIIITGPRGWASYFFDREAADAGGRT